MQDATVVPSSFISPEQLTQQEIALITGQAGHSCPSTCYWNPDQGLCVSIASGGPCIPPPSSFPFTAKLALWGALGALLGIGLALR